jgi:methylglutaconyl-CoA hydratase
MDELRVDLREHALWLTIDRPGRRNAMDQRIIEGLTDAIAHAGRDPGVRVIVVTAAGDQTFCVGADMKSATALALDPSTPDQPFSRLLRAAHASKVPLIARVNGICMAGGVALVAMCDMAIAADHATFGLPEVKVGLFPMQILAVLQGLIPARDLYEMCLTGEPVDAHEAKAMGLLNHVVPADQLDAKVEWLVDRLVDKSPSVIRRGRYALRQAQAMPFAESIAFTEGQMGLVMLDDDAREGMQAFMQKRKPVWKGT